MSFLKTGDHTQDAYSMFGRTIDLKRLRNISLSMYVNVRNMRPKFLFATLILVLMCFENVSLLSIITPRSFATSTFFNRYLFLILFHGVSLIHIMYP